MSPFGKLQPSSPKNLVDGSEIFLYDEIGFWGVTAADFVRDLRSMDPGPISLRINSPGGSVFDGVAIMQALEERGDVTVHVDGLAASMASGIAMAGDEIIIGKSAFMMIHDPWSFVIGDAQDMRAEAELLDQIGDTLAANYAGRADRTVADVRDLMRAETWMNGEEAVDMGFADTLAGDDGGEASDLLTFDLGVYEHVPKALQMTSTPNGAKILLERGLRQAGLSRKQARDWVKDAERAFQRKAADDAPSDEARELADDTRARVAQLRNQFKD